MSTDKTDDQIEKLMRILRSKRMKKKEILEDEDDDNGIIEEDEKKDDPAAIGSLMSRMRAGIADFGANFGANALALFNQPPPYPAASGRWNYDPASDPAFAALQRASSNAQARGRHAQPSQQASWGDSLHSFFGGLNYG